MIYSKKKIFLDLIKEMMRDYRVQKVFLTNQNLGWG